MKIRRAVHADAPALTALILASKRSNGYDDAFMAACVDELSVTAQDIDTQTHWVAEGPAGPMGCVALETRGTTGVIHAFFIHPDHKRQGIGRTLWQVVQDAAATQGLSLLVLDADPAAVAFYSALGFEVVSEAPSGSIPGRMLPHMQMTL